ncbi:hypothetical protein [Nitrospira moscoviensis]|uniref:DUF4401 domain-containing protein n=1 Tax=Nitrospira moscoviensis TaxID=42253 RepID=A0A0K2GD06_NITMO|nr:hypothetical protein [Nitrospira moscoviensis]ALA58840.1 membrane protein of unknown function [Nitrospira moscoviensis]
MERWMDIQKLGQLLRWMGSLLLLGASASFMLEGWQDFGSELRYFLFLSYVLGLAGLGIVLGWRVREDKGARTLLGLAVVGIAAQYSQLGAMIHSLVSGEQGTLPDSLLFDVTNWATVAVNAAAILALAPVAYLGFSALNRPHALRLTAMYLFACSTLLIPVRQGLPLAGIFIGAALLVLWFDSRFLAGTTTGGTAEGMASRLLLLVPVGILVARSAFYPQTPLFVGVTTISAGLVCFEMLPKLVKDDAARVRVQVFATAPIIAGWCVITFQYLPTVFRALPPLWTWLPLSLILTGLSFRASGGARLYRNAAASVAVLAVMGQLAAQATIFTSFFCLAFSIAMVVAGFHYQERIVFTAGIAATILSLGYHLRFAAQLYAYSPWGLLAGLGLLILVSASYMEKHATRLFGRLVLLRQEMKGWR